jgi:hypothetical protein
LSAVVPKSAFFAKLAPAYRYTRTCEQVFCAASIDVRGGARAPGSVPRQDKALTTDKVAWLDRVFGTRV